MARVGAALGRDQEATLQTQREMAHEIIAIMRSWDMPRIRDALFDEATGHVVFQLDCHKPLFAVRFSVPECMEAAPLSREVF